MNFHVTTPNTYLTGLTALNLPDPQAPSGDWHFTSAVLNPAARIHTAGDAGNLVNTNQLLGSHGIYDCAQSLRSLGIPVDPDDHVYAASHVRAVLDLVIRNILNKHFPHHLEADKWLTSPEQWEELNNTAKALENQLPVEARDLLREWLDLTLQRVELRA